MPNWVRAASVKDVRHRRSLRVELDGVPVVLFRAGDRVYALHDTCVHQDRSLAKGTLLSGRVVCPGHQWAFDLETGECDDRDECQPTYAVRVADDAVWVDLERPATAGRAALLTAVAS